MRGRKHNNRKLPLASWLMILVVLGSLCTGTVAAYLSYVTQPVTNTFTPDKSEIPEVIKETQGTSDKGLGVSVGNTDYEVYVRAAVVVSWKSEKNPSIQPAKAPKVDQDYLIVLNLDDWFLHTDGFYYYKKPVKSGGQTEPLVKSYDDYTTTIEGYIRYIEIMGQTIQALGTTDEGDIPAVTDAWGVYVDANGELTPTPPTT